MLVWVVTWWCGRRRAGVRGNVVEWYGSGGVGGDVMVVWEATWWRGRRCDGVGGYVLCVGVAGCVLA